MKSYLQSKGTSSELAEEAVQEALLNVWRKAAQFDPQKASASTWIFAIARNTRIDLLRKSNRPALDPNDPALVPDPPKAAFDTVAVAKKRIVSENRLRFQSSNRRSYALRFLRSCPMRKLLAGSTSPRNRKIPYQTGPSAIRSGLEISNEYRSSPEEELLLDYATGALDEG